MANRVAVRSGQVWTDNDYRRPVRNLRVLSVPRKGQNAGRVRVCDQNGREYFVSARRFNGTTRGYSQIS